MIEAATQHTRAACLREVQNSIKDSVKQLIEDKIHKLGFTPYFRITDQEITGPCDSLFIFKGLQNHTVTSMKSLEGFNRALIEEAQAISKRSLEMLTPTFRSNSEMWFAWNPGDPEDPVDMLFLENEDDPDFILVRANHDANPWFPDELRRDMERDRRNDPDKYAHVWLGEYITKTDAQVLSGRYIVDVFTPQADWDGPYFGADWGFSVDPTALIKCWVHANKLYIEAEAYGHEVSTVNMPGLFDKIPGSRTHVIRADNARPEMADHMRKHGFPRCVSADKWPGSVEDGIEHLRGYDKIIIHPHCPLMFQEARKWSWKVDRKSGDVMPELAAGNDHGWDAARYALAPLIKRREPARQVRVNLMER